MSSSPVPIEPPSHPRLADARHWRTAKGEAYLSVETHRDGVQVISLVRGSKHAFDDPTYLALSDALLQAQADPKVLVVVITGSKNYFSSGADVENITDFSLKVNQGLINDPVGVFMRIVVRFPKPLVAAVSGPAIGIGSTLLPHCDLVYCTDKTFFWTPFSRLALAPEFGSSLLFPQILGMTVANEMLLMSKQLPAKRAFELGLVSAVFPEAGFLDKVLSEVRAGLVYPMLDITLPLFKEMIRKRDLAKVEQAIEYELRILDERAERGEIAQAVVQFVQAEAKRREAKL